MDFHSLTRRELQTLCKKNGIPANITNVAMADALTALHATTVQGIEEISDCSQSVTAQSSVESPERAEVTSPRVPRTRTTRKKVENATVVNKTTSTTRILTRNKKDTVAPINIDVQFSEVDKQSEISKGKEACIPQTPSMVSDTRKRSSKAESTARKAYGTRRSTRLAVKTSEDTNTNLENKEKPDAANMKLFSADCGDNFEVNDSECCADLSEDVQSNVSHLKEDGSETNKCEEITSNYSGVDIPNDLGRDSPKDSNKSAGKVKIDEENGIQGNMWNEGNKGDDINEEAEIENKDEVIGENGDDINEQPEMENKDEVMGENGDDTNEQAEVEMKDEVTGDNGVDITKQSNTEMNIEVAAETREFYGEGDKLNGNGEVVTGGDEVCGVDSNVNDDNVDGKLVSEMMDMSLTSNDDMITQTEDHDGWILVPEMNDGMVLGDNGGMLAETENHAVSDAVVVDEFVPMSEEEEKDLVKVVGGEHVDNSGCDIPSQNNSKDDEFLPQLKDEGEKEKEEHDLVKVAAGKQVDKVDCDEPIQENSKEDKFFPKSEDEKVEEEDLDKAAAGEQLVDSDCDKEHEFLLNSESSKEEEQEEEEEDLVNVAAGEQMVVVNGDSDKPSQKNSIEDEFSQKSFSSEESSEEDESEDESEEESEEESEDESEEEDLVKPSELSSKKDGSSKASILVDNEDSQKNSIEDEFSPKSFSSEESSEEDETEEETEEESEEESEDESEEEDLVKVATGVQLDKPSELSSKEDRSSTASILVDNEEESEEESEDESEEEDLVKVATGVQLDEPSELSSKEDGSSKASILVDNEDSILLPATTAPLTPGKKKPATSSSIMVVDNPNAVLVVGKENKPSELSSKEDGSSKASILVDNEDSILLPATTAPLTPGKKKPATSSSTMVVKENMGKENMDEYSLRQLRKMVKELNINADSKNAKKDKLVKKSDEELEETASRRPALQMLPENQM